MAEIDRNSKACRRFAHLVSAARLLSGQRGLSFMDCLEVLAKKAFKLGEGLPEDCKRPPWIPQQGDERLRELLEYSIRYSCNFRAFRPLRVSALGCCAFNKSNTGLHIR